MPDDTVDRLGFTLLWQEFWLEDRSQVSPRGTFKVVLDETALPHVIIHYSSPWRFPEIYFRRSSPPYFRHFPVVASLNRKDSPVSVERCLHVFDVRFDDSVWDGYWREFFFNKVRFYYYGWEWLWKLLLNFYLDIYIQ